MSDVSAVEVSSGGDQGTETRGKGLALDHHRNYPAGRRPVLCDCWR